MTRRISAQRASPVWVGILAAACGLFWMQDARSQTAPAFPTKPVRIVVPFTPGGSSDILARLIGASLRELWGQAPIVENKTGAGGSIGADAVAKAPADGYTLLVTDLGTMTILPSLQKSLPWDLHKDLAPVTSISFSPYLAVVAPKLPIKTLQELVEYSKANPGKLNFATPGMGSNPHLAGLQFSKAMGIEWTYIPSKGGASALQDVAGGHADLIFNSMLATAPHVKSGAVRLVGVTSPKRLEAYPDAAAASEMVPGFTAGSWQGVFTTGATPRAIVAKLNADIVKVLGTAEVRERIVQMGAQPIANKPEEMDKFLRDDRERWARVIKENNLKVDQ
jgi:tripartite-type tricarboxylate transporter receptor subunit TctC